MNHNDHHSTTVAVVDSHPHDYALFDPLVDSGKLTLHFLAQGRLALRWSQQHKGDLWMINVQLVDIPGLDLFEMLATTIERVPVFIITNSYCAEEEVRALRLGATKYLCKPAAISWLATLRLPTRPRRTAKVRQPVKQPQPGNVPELGYKPAFYTALDDT